MIHIAEGDSYGTIVTVFCRRFVRFAGGTIDLAWDAAHPSSQAPSCFFCIVKAAQYTPVYGAYISCTADDPLEDLYGARIP